MYLAELTRNAFQSGVSATKWLALCKLMIETTPVHAEAQRETASGLSNSVLVLYRSYPGDPGLQEYLKAAIQDGILPVSTFVSTLLQAARSSELHIPATLDTLCRIALDFHYSSGQPPLGSVVPSSESITAILGTVLDALALLRTAYSLPISHFHQLTTSVSELVVLLLSCVSDISQVSHAQAVVYYHDVQELLTNYSFRLTPDVRQVLDAFVMSLTLLLGDDGKARREAQSAPTIQFSLGKGDVLGPSSDTDIITLGLLLNYMVAQRAHAYGAGDDKHAVALLVASFRWSSWTPATFYTQLSLAAFTCLTQHGSNARLWKAFIVGRLPTLLVSFSEIVKKGSDTAQNTDLIGGLHEGLSALFRRPDVIVEAEHTLSGYLASESSAEDDSSRSFSRDFLQQLVKYNLISTQVATQLDPLSSSDMAPKWHAEANDQGVDLANYLESKLTQDNGGNESKLWIDRIWKDCSSHVLFASMIHKRFSSAAAGLEVETLGQLCKILHTFSAALDIVALHKPIIDLLFYAIQFLEDYDCETVGDPQTAFSHLGDVVLFVQYALARFKFENLEITKDRRTVFARLYMNAEITAQRTQAEISLFNAWFKALFDSSIEGIEDNILRSTSPKFLLKFAPFLFTQAIGLGIQKKIEMDVLFNGITYFSGPLLNWTLVGIIRQLIKEIQYKQFLLPQCQPYYDIIQNLLLSPSCPKSVIALCSPQIMVLITEKKRPHPSMVVPSSFKVSAIRQLIAEASCMKGGDMVTPTLGQTWYLQVQQAVQITFNMATAHKAPFLDVRRCLKTLPPIKFVQLLWTELIAAATSGNIEASRRVATFVLTIPHESTTYPILPLFMNILLPSIIINADKLPPSEQTLVIEVLVAIVSSALNGAIHLEWAMRSVSEDDNLVLGQTSASLARRLASTLRQNRDSTVSILVLQRLTSSPSFIANFPAFVGDVGS